MTPVSDQTMAYSTCNACRGVGSWICTLDWIGLDFDTFYYLLMNVSTLDKSVDMHAI